MRAIVCGAGIAGLTVACRLAEADWQVTILEKSSGPRAQGYMIDFFGPGFDAAERLGLVPALRQLAHAVSTVDYVTTEGRRTCYIDYASMVRAAGGKFLSLMRPELEEVLRASLPSSVELRYGAELVDVRDSGATVEVETATGDTLTGDVLVGADGIHSRVRSLVLGPEERFVRHLGFHTCAFTFTAPDLVRRLDGRFIMTDTIDRSIGLYATDATTVAVFGAHRTGPAPLPDDPRAAVLAAYSGLGSLVDEALAHCPDADQIYYDLVAQSVLPQWSSGRVALVGDACHAVSLLAGQGASLAVAAGRELAERLVDDPDPAVAFAGFEAAWKQVSLDKQLAGRRSAGSFVPHSWLDIWLRRIALRAMILPPIRGLVMTRLIGKSGAVYERG